MGKLIVLIPFCVVQLLESKKLALGPKHLQNRALYQYFMCNYIRTNLDGDWNRVGRVNCEALH